MERSGPKDHYYYDKKNIILILIGIFFVSLRFNISFGHITIDIANELYRLSSYHSWCSSYDEPQFTF